VLPWRSILMPQNRFNNGNLFIYTKVAQMQRSGEWFSSQELNNKRASREPSQDCCSSRGCNICSLYNG
nr:hypothetical protein [Tanacetum cinerariifolium]